MTPKKKSAIFTFAVMALFLFIFIEPSLFGTCYCAFVAVAICALLCMSMLSYLIWMLLDDTNSPNPRTLETSKPRNIVTSKPRNIENS